MGQGLNQQPPPVPAWESPGGGDMCPPGLVLPAGSRLPSTLLPPEPAGRRKSLREADWCPLETKPGQKGNLHFKIIFIMISMCI